MRAAGCNVKKIADVLNNEHILSPSDYKYSKLGRTNPRHTHHLWSVQAVKRILRNQIYIGNLAQLRTTTVTYKNHKVIRKDESDWVVVEHNHEPIITQELWDKVREVDASVSTGKATKKGVTMPLSGLCYCEKCGTKMKQQSSSGCKNSVVGYDFFCLGFIKEQCIVLVKKVQKHRRSNTLVSEFAITEFIYGSRFCSFRYITFHTSFHTDL